MPVITTPLLAPFPWFGGKARVARRVWARFGEVRNYVEPFFGSGAVLLGRPTPFDGTETVNDLDGLVANFWRALRSEPDAVADHADWPVNENDLHARHIWLVNRKDSLQARLEGDPEFYDSKVAGWWVWGLCVWIGSGWCSGEGPWNVAEVDGSRQLVHLGDAGQGVNRQLVHLGDAGRGVHRQRVHLSWGNGLHGAQVGNNTCVEWSEHLRATMRALADRLRRVRVCCGDWARVCGPTPTVKQGLTAVFLDPPYADTAGRDSGHSGDPRLYAKDSHFVAHDVREWAIEHGDDPRMRICLAGYEDEHVMPDSWECVAWKAKGGYGSQRSDGTNANARRERLWFSPHCLKPRGRAAYVQPAFAFAD
jgi:hypothetical protein